MAHHVRLLPRLCADIRERAGGIADITTREQIEGVMAKILKLLSF